MGGRPKGSTKQADREARAKRYLDSVGPRPSDPLELAGWALRAAGLALEGALGDTGQSDRECRAEIRATTKTIAALMPIERMRQAERLIRGDLEKTQRDEREVETVNATGGSIEYHIGNPRGGAA